jgi:hypothetical protein
MVLTKANQKEVKQNFSKIEKYIDIKNLEIENHDLSTDWSKIGQFKNLESLSISNSLINGDVFYKNLALLKEIKTLSIDESCYFLKHEIAKKSQLNFSALKKFIFVCLKKDQINFDLETSVDNHKEGKLNFLSFPNFPACLPSLEEIEIRNYENYLKKKELDYYDEETDSQNEIIYKLNFHNFSRIKNLKNIILCKTNEELFKNEKLISKIFQFPNDKKIKVNNNLISDIKTKLGAAKEIYLDFDQSKINYDDQFDNTISKYDLKPDSIIVHYPSHHYLGYSDRFQQIFDSAGIMVINSLKQFEEYLENIDSFVDEFLDNFIKGKSLKKIQIKINNSETTSYGLECLIRKIEESKKIEYEVIFEQYSNDKELSIDYGKYLAFFYFILHANKKKKHYKFSTNLDNDYLKIFLEKVFFNQVKTIMVIEDQANSKIFKNLNDIEIPIVDWPYIGEGFKTYEYNLDFDNLKKELDFRDFFYEQLWYGHTYLPENKFLDNPSNQAVFVKKEFLDKSKKIIFNNVENISFQRIASVIKKVADFEDYKDLKEKKFKFPSSVNKKNIKRLYIQDNFIFRISDLEEFENLEEFNFSGHLDEEDKNMNIFPKMDKLRFIDYSVDYPFIKQSDSTFKNFENSQNLEKITLGLGYNTRRDEGRWTLYTVDVSKFNNLKKLNFLELDHFEQDKIKNLNNLNNLKTFNLINPFMITEDHRSDDGFVHQPLTEDDFKFLAQSKELENLQIYFPRFGKARINIDFEKFIKYLNPKLKSIHLRLALDQKQLQQAHNLYNSVIKNLKEVEKIDINIDDAGFPELKYNKRKKDGYEIALREHEKKAKNPIIIDLKSFNDFKNLKSLNFKFSSYIGTKIKNLISIKSFKKLNLIVEEHLLDANELKKLFYSIASKKDIYMYEYNRNRKKMVEYSWNLDEKNKKEYEKIEKESDYETKEITINGDSIDKILLKKKKK